MLNDCNGGLVVCKDKVVLRFLNTAKQAPKAIDANVRFRIFADYFKVDSLLIKNVRNVAIVNIKRINSYCIQRA